MDWKCVACNSENSGDVIRCTCGYEFSSTSAPEESKLNVKSAKETSPLVAIGVLLIILGAIGMVFALTIDPSVSTGVLTGSRWCLLKRPENCTEKQAVKLKELVSINLKTVRAYLLKEDFQRFWSYKSAGWAAKFLDQWCKRTMRSRIDPIKKIGNVEFRRPEQ